MKYLKIGELAKMVGITVRSLHHYDELGLLKPRGTSRSLHRFYGLGDIERLQQIISLKSIGFSLREIKRLLDDKDFDLGKSLAMHQEMIQTKIEEYQRIHQLLRLMLFRLAQDLNIDITELLQLIKEIKNMENIYTKEQLARLKKRYETYGLDRVKEVELGWLELFKKFEEAMKKGLQPDSSDVQVLAKKAQEYIDLFTGKDREIEARLDSSYAQQQAQAFEKWSVKKEVFEFASKARKILKKG